jgi:excisionase family DNA binding protein
MTHPTPTPTGKLARLNALTYSAAELADALGCSERHIRRLADSRQLPAGVRIGRLVRWPRKIIDVWIADGCPKQPLTRG